MTAQLDTALFDPATAAELFGGPNRIVEVTNSGDSGAPYPKRQVNVLLNGWVFSAIWGYGAYCTAARPSAGIIPQPSEFSPDAEVRCWREKGGVLRLHRDEVEGWISPASFARALEAAERDDEDAIRAALVRREV